MSETTIYNWLKQERIGRRGGAGTDHRLAHGARAPRHIRQHIGHETSPYELAGAALLTVLASTRPGLGTSTADSGSANVEAPLPDTPGAGVRLAAARAESYAWS